ncbi:MAG: VOC family protein [bacterium]|nr:VOC family protein [bacterium]
MPVSPPPPEPAEADAATRAKAGRIAWLDLTVHDADAARDFYAAVIGWTPDPASMKDDAGAYSDYCMLAGGQAVAGVCHARGPNLGLPPVWMLYVPVGDLNASIAAIEPSGGSVLEVMRGKGDAPTGVILRDPIGAHMALVAG